MKLRLAVLSVVLAGCVSLWLQGANGALKEHASFAQDCHETGASACGGSQNNPCGCNERYKTDSCGGASCVYDKYCADTNCK